MSDVKEAEAEDEEAEAARGMCASSADVGEVAGGDSSVCTSLHEKFIASTRDDNFVDGRSYTGPVDKKK